ncbi:MAG TPA: SCO family protein [Candidatus Azoamicus sp.]
MLYKRIYIYILLLLLFPFLINAFPSNSIYNLDINLLDKNGKNLKIKDLSGRVQVFSMIYTNCKTICPIIIANMKAIEKLVLINGIKDISFSLVSLDPDRDSIETLNKYFHEKKMNSISWNLYKSSKNETLRLSLAVGIKYKKEKNNEYTHSNLIIILDKHGVIKMHHQGLDKNFDSLLKLLFDLNL